MKYLLLLLIPVLIITGCSNDENPANNDTTPPTVQATSPTGGAVDVAVDAVVTATFSEDINPSTVAASTFYMDGGVTGTVVYSNRIATLTPSADLDFDIEYTATVSSAIKDDAGNNMAGNHVWTFTTESNPSIAPTVLSTSPVSGATEVPINSVITAKFSEDMNPTTIAPSTFYLSDGVTGTVTYADSMATLLPAGDLDFDHAYTATITTAVKDESGTSMEANKIWSFTTMPNVLMPLRVGNLWEAQVSLFDDLGNFLYSYADSVKLIAFTTINSEQWYIDNSGDKYYNDTDGLWRIVGSGQEHLFLKYPATVGETYTAEPDYNQTMEVLSVDTTISVAAGTFMCYLYESSVPVEGHPEDPPVLFHYFYSPGAGLLMWKTYHDSSESPLKIEAVWNTTNISLL